MFPTSLMYPGVGGCVKSEVRAREYPVPLMVDGVARDLKDPSEEQPYSSFLIRCWGLSDGKRRIKVQHVQSGEWVRAASFADAVDWMEKHCGIPNWCDSEDGEQ